MTNEFITLEDVYAAFYDCRKHKGSTCGCMEYELNYIDNNYQLYAELNSMTYEISQSRAFCVTRPKLREVFCAAYRDRIVHHLLALKFNSLFEEELTAKAYACRKRKGTEYGICDVQAQMERVTKGHTMEAWVLRGDMQGFFMSIDRLRLYTLLERIIRARYHEKDIEWWLWLWKKIVTHDPTTNCIKVGDPSLFRRLPKNKSLFTCGKGKGLPIGNLPSQMLANLLLASFDKLMIMRIGTDGGYGRYVDDFVVIHSDKSLLLDTIQWAREYLREELGLTLHPHKLSIQRASQGVRFTGVMIRPFRALPNPRIVEHLYAVVDEFGMVTNPQGEELYRYANRINSLLGILACRSSYNVRRRAWLMMPHKDRVYCANMRAIKIKTKYKLKMKNNEESDWFCQRVHSC